MSISHFETSFKVTTQRLLISPRPAILKEKFYKNTIVRLRFEFLHRARPRRRYFSFSNALSRNEYYINTFDVTYARFYLATEFSSSITIHDRNITEVNITKAEANLRIYIQGRRSFLRTRSKVSFRNPPATGEDFPAINAAVKVLSGSSNRAISLTRYRIFLA